MSEHHVLQDREVVGQHEVLMHHADPGGYGVLGGAEVHLLAIDAERPLVGPLHPVQDLHEGGLPGAVLADDCVDLGGHHPEMDVLVRHDTGEPLRDPLELDGRSRVRHVETHMKDGTEASPRTRPTRLRLQPVPRYLDGTVISPLMIFCLRSSSWLLMSSMNPPDVE